MVDTLSPTPLQVVLTPSLDGPVKTVHWALLDLLGDAPLHQGTAVGDKHRSWLDVHQLALGAAFRQLRPFLA